MKLGHDVGDVTDVGIADGVRQRERALCGGDLDDSGDVDVSVHNEPSAPAAVGVHLRVSGSSAANRGDDKCAKRRRRLMGGQQSLGMDDVDVEQAVQRHRMLARP